MTRAPRPPAQPQRQRDWRQPGRGGPPPRADNAREEDAPSMSRSRVQLATAYAPDILFTWEGAKGICRAVPVSRPADDIKQATRMLIFQGIQEAAESWLERALTVRADPATIPLTLVLDAPLLDERAGAAAVDGLRDFKLTRPDRIGYIPFPLLFRCGTCGRLREFENVNQQAANPLPERCSGHTARWTQVDVVYAHWSGGMEPLSPFRYQHNAATGEVSRINKCDCGCDDFKLLNDAPVFSEWKFVCNGCGATRELKQADPRTLRQLKPRMDRGERHEWIEINMLPVSYRANSAYYVQKGYFIDFEDRRVVELMMPPMRPELLRSIAALHGFPYDEPTDAAIEDALTKAGRGNEYTAWQVLGETAERFRQLGLASQAATYERDAQQQRESWFSPNGPVQRGSVRSASLTMAVQDRGDWARRYDPIRLTIEHDIFVREHITQRLANFGAVNVLNPDRLISEAAGDAAKLATYQQTTGDLLRRIGVETMVLIRGLPICEYSFGYSRVAAGPTYNRENGNRVVPMPVRLNAFPMLPESNQRPVYVLEQKNEALYVRLSEDRVRSWLAANGVTPTPYADKPGIAGTYLEQYSDFTPFLDNFKGHEGRGNATREFCPYVYMLLHSLSHQMIHALAELSGLDRDGIGEHIFPADLAFVIYRKGMTPDLGNVSAMWRNFSAAFLQRILDTRLLRCGSGTLCDSRGAACPACIMLPDLTCIASNQLLSRSALKGGPPPTWEARTNPALIGYFDPGLLP